MKNIIIAKYFCLFGIIAALSNNLPVKADDTNNFQLAIPGASWSLEIASSGFTLEENRFSKDGKAGRLKAINKKTGMIMTAFLEKAQSDGDAKKCREFYWNDAQKSPMKKDDVKLSEMGSTALVEYVVKEYGGMAVNQKNMNSYLSGNGYWVDVHLSKTDFKSEDEALFLSVAKSIHFNDHFIPKVIEWATWGSFFMSKENYPEAVRCNEKAWEQNSSQLILAREQKVFLLDDLINGYGNLGNNKKAKQLSELGLQIEPDYPSFYYGLACSYAELGDKDQALENLKKAFQNKSKLFAGDQLANPQMDSSFSRFSRDPNFAKFFAGLNK